MEPKLNNLKQNNTQNDDENNYEKYNKENNNNSIKSQKVKEDSKLEKVKKIEKIENIEKVRISDNAKSILSFNNDNDKVKKNKTINIYNTNNASDPSINTESDNLLNSVTNFSISEYELKQNKNNQSKQNNTTDTFDLWNSSKLLVKYVLILVLLYFICLILYHIFKIGMVLRYQAIGIGQKTYREEPNTNLNTSSYKIPKIVHQIWKTDNISTYPMRNSHEFWKSYYPDYNVTLWSEEKILKFITEEYYWMLPLYTNYTYDIQRADVARYIILYHYGGVYADLDCFPSRTASINDLLDADLVLTKTYDGKGISNHFMLASVKLPFLLNVLKELVEYNDYIAIPYLRVFYSTGPLFLTIQINKYLENFDLVIVPQIGNKYNIHYPGRSWHMLDGMIFNWIAENTWKFIMILIILVIIISLICQRCRRRRTMEVFT